MSLRRTTLTAVITLLAAPALAQERIDMTDLNAAIEMQRYATEAERTMIVAENLRLTIEQDGEFWPMHRKYRADVAELNDRYVALVTRYANNYETLDDKTALTLIKESLDLQQDRVKLQKKYINRFNKIMGGKNTARYLQIEGRLDAVVDLKLRASIPLVM